MKCDGKGKGMWREMLLLPNIFEVSAILILIVT